MLQVKEEAIKDPHYSPYCLMCSTMNRMKKVMPFLWTCENCGAVHDERENVTPATENVQHKRPKHKTKEQKMENQIDNELVEFVRSVVLGLDTPQHLREKGLSILLDLQRTTGQCLAGTCLVTNGSLSFRMSSIDYNRIQNLILGNQKINAIKDLRAVTNWGLLEAKQAVESPKNFKQAPQTQPYPY